MGVAYRATDTKLGRDVAIKVIPEIFAQDADRMARFAREAQLLAALNHQDSSRSANEELLLETGNNMRPELADGGETLTLPRMVLSPGGKTLRRSACAEEKRSQARSSTK